MHITLINAHLGPGFSHGLCLRSHGSLHIRWDGHILAIEMIVIYKQTQVRMVALTLPLFPPSRPMVQWLHQDGAVTGEGHNIKPGSPLPSTPTHLHLSTDGLSFTEELSKLLGAKDAPQSGLGEQVR